MTIDKYEDILVVESLALGIDRMKEDNRGTFEGNLSGGRRPDPGRV